MKREHRFSGPFFGHGFSRIVFLILNLFRIRISSNESVSPSFLCDPPRALRLKPRGRSTVDQPEHHTDQRGADDPGDDAPHLDLAPVPPVGAPHAGEQIITMLLLPSFRLFFSQSNHQVPLYDEQRGRPYSSRGHMTTTLGPAQTLR